VAVRPQLGVFGHTASRSLTFLEREWVGLHRGRESFRISGW
jgi:hypothetical protein